MGRPSTGTWVLAALAPLAFLAVDPAGWYPFGPAKWLAVSTLVPLGAARCWRRGSVPIDRTLGRAVAALLVLLVLATVFGDDPWYAWVGTPERNFGVLTWGLAAVALLAGSSLRSASGSRRVDHQWDADHDGGLVAGLGPGFGPGAGLVAGPGPGRPTVTQAAARLAPAANGGAARCGDSRGRLSGERAVVVVGLVLAGVGVGLVAAAEALGWQAGPIGLGGGRLTGTFGSAAYLGAAAALVLPVTVGVALDRGCDRRLRGLAGIGVVTLSVATVGAGARAAWVGLAVAGLVVAWARRRWLAAHAGPALVAGALALVALGVVAVATPAGERVRAAFDVDAPGGRGRVDEWRVAARVVARHPVLGVGPEGYRTAFAEGADEAYERAHGRSPLPDRAHAGPFDVALAGGLGAAVAWLVVMGGIGRSLLRAVAAGRPWLVGLAAGLGAHWAGQLLLFPTFELEPVAWLLAGVVVAETARPGEVVERTVPPWVPVALTVLAVVAAAAGGIGLWADRRADDVAQGLGGPDPAQTLARADAAVALRPDVVRYRLLQGRARVAAGEGTLAGLDSVDAALAISPRDPLVRLERAGLLVARARATQVPAQVVEARDYLEELVAADPVNASLRLLEGEAAVLADDADAAEAAWSEAEHLAPGDASAPARLAQLYLATGRPGDARRAATRALTIDPDQRVAQQVLDQLDGS